MEVYTMTKTVASKGKDQLRFGREANDEVEEDRASYTSEWQVAA